MQDFGYLNVIRIAREAGQNILKFYDLFKQMNETSHKILLPQKSDKSPLTKADLAAHHIISTQLKNLTPNVPVVSEEDQTSWKYRQPNHTFWLVDPLDGTKEFIAKNDQFTVNIALIENGISVFGVIFAPVLNEMYWGGKEYGAFVDHRDKIESIHVSKHTADNSPIRILASKSHLNSETKAFIEKFHSYTLIKAGSSLKFCRIAEGAADIYPRLSPTCEWDTAAGQAIVEGAGGHVLKLDGKVLHYGKDEIYNPHFIVSGTSQIERWFFDKSNEV